MFTLINYHKKSFLSSNKYIMPLLSYILILLMLCISNIGSQKALYVFSMVLGYFLATWSGFVYAESEEQITEQIMVLKAPSIITYYVSKVLFVAIWSIPFTIIGWIIPLIWSIISAILGGNIEGLKLLFSVTNIQSAVASIIMHLCITILGGMIGYLLHPRVFYNRKISAIATFSIAAIGIIKGPFFEELKIPAAKLISWLLPPVFEIVQSCNMETEIINIGGIIVPCIYALVYSTLLATINVIVISKRGF